VVRQSSRLIITLAIVLFVSGLTAGFILGRMTMTPPREGPPHMQAPPAPKEIKKMMAARLFERIQLTSDQEKQIEPAVDCWFEQLDQLRRKGTPDVQKVFNELFDKVNPLLTTQQQSELVLVRKQIMECLVREGRPFSGPPHRPEADHQPNDNRRNPPPPM